MPLTNECPKNKLWYEFSIKIVLSVKVTNLRSSLDAAASMSSMITDTLAWLKFDVSVGCGIADVSSLGAVSIPAPISSPEVARWMNSCPVLKIFSCLG